MGSSRSVPIETSIFQCGPLKLLTREVTGGWDKQLVSFLGDNGFDLL